MQDVNFKGCRYYTTMSLNCWMSDFLVIQMLSVNTQYMCIIVTSPLTENS